MNNSGEQLEGFARFFWLGVIPTVIIGIIVVGGLLLRRAEERARAERRAMREAAEKKENQPS